MDAIGGDRSQSDLAHAPCRSHEKFGELYGRFLDAKAKHGELYLYVPRNEIAGRGRSGALLGALDETKSPNCAPQSRRLRPESGVFLVGWLRRRGSGSGSAGRQRVRTGRPELHQTVVFCCS